MNSDVVLARRTLADLSDLLRQSLRNSSQHEVTLASELEFLTTYQHIQQARFGSRLRFTRDVDSKYLQALIPRMILQPLVENSIRHGMLDGDEVLEITVQVDAAKDTLRVSVADNGAGLTTAGLEEGVGIRNTRQRLEKLYGQGHKVDFRKPESGGFEISIVIPIRYSPIVEDKWADDR
jgi:two-component system, LytTR family, sensor kinase